MGQTTHWSTQKKTYGLAPLAGCACVCAGLLVAHALLGGIAAAGSLLQRRLDLPDATTMVLQGLLFVSILAGEAFMPKERR